MGAITAEVVETGEKRDTRGRRVTPAGRRAELVEAYRRSGSTMTAFARREGINYATFAHWVAKAPRPTAAKAPLKFAELRLPLASAIPEPAGEWLEVRWPDGTVLRGARVADLVALARALRG
jgi:transposase-like protein